MAVRDRIISDSPSAHLKYTKREKPIRLILTEQLNAIVDECSRAVFNADAQDSADFLDFSDSPGSAKPRLGR